MVWWFDGVFRVGRLELKGMLCIVVVNIDLG